jgi:phage-related protein
MGKNLFELRLKSKEGLGRVFYCNRPDRRLMMLHAFVKKSAKAPPQELKIARDRMSEVQPDADA